MSNFGIGVAFFGYDWQASGDLPETLPPRRK